MQVRTKLGKAVLVASVLAMPVLASAFGGGGGGVTPPPAILTTPDGPGGLDGPPAIIVVMTPTDTNNPNKAVMTPGEAWNLDTKLDDGAPATGDVVVSGPSTDTATNCTDAPNSNSLTAKYLVSSTNKACSVVSRNAF